MKCFFCVCDITASRIPGPKLTQIDVLYVLFLRISNERARIILISFNFVLLTTKKKRRIHLCAKFSQNCLLKHEYTWVPCGVFDCQKFFTDHTWNVKELYHIITIQLKVSTRTAVLLFFSLLSLYPALALIKENGQEFVLLFKPWVVQNTNEIFDAVLKLSWPFYHSYLVLFILVR